MSNKPTSQKSAAASTKIVIAALTKDANKHLKKIEKITKIKTKEEYDLIAEKIKAVKELGKQAKAKKKTILDPLAVVEKEVRSLFKGIEDLCEESEADYKELMEDWVKTQTEKEEQLTEKFDKGVMTIKSYSGKVAQLDTSSDFATVKKHMVAEIVDLNKLPREFMVPDMKAINAACKDGKVPAGVKYEVVKKIAI